MPRIRILAVAATLGLLAALSSPTPPSSAARTTWTTVKSSGFHTRAAPGQVDRTYRDTIESYDFGNYHPSQMSVHDGVLDVHLTQGKGAGFVLGPARSRWGQTYGRFTVNFKAEGAAGYGTAMMLWPSDSSRCPRGGCWDDGEIDFPEGRLDKTMSVNHHPVGCVAGGTAHKRDCASADSKDTGVRFTGGYHTAVTEWTPTQVRYFLDGVLRHSVRHDVPTSDHRMTIQFGPDVAEPTAGHFYINWYRIERYGR